MRKETTKYILKSVSYTVVANGISLLITAFLTVWVPKTIPVAEYGLWQLFVLYQGYLGFFHFGWNDGIYLRFGGRKYEELNKGLFFSQFWMQALLLSVFGIGVAVAGRCLLTGERIYICDMLALNMLFLNTRCMLLYVLQATARIKEYAVVTICDRMAYVALSVIGIEVLGGNYHVFLVADLLAKILSLSLTCVCCRDIVLRKVGDFSWHFREGLANIKVGINLLFANLAGMLVLGVIRIGIENTWGIEVFGKVSLTITLSQLCIGFLNTVGIIVFPLLRRLDNSELRGAFFKLERLTCSFLLGILVFYYPVKAVADRWLPDYSESVRYMAIIFPICFYEGKMALVNNTYLKALRKEKEIRHLNWVTVLLSACMTFVTAYVLHSLTLTVLLILVVIAARCVMADRCLYAHFKESYKKDFLMETGMVAFFVLSNWRLGGLKGAAVYMVVYGVYFLAGFLHRESE